MEKTNYPLNSVLKINYLFISLSFLSFSIPLFLNSSQIITGTLVNTILFLSAYFMPKKYQLPLIFLPSVGVMVRGALFGTLTWFLFYFLPFIWLGNYLLIFTFQRMKKGVGILPSVILSALVKQALLLFSARLYFIFGIVPSPFLISMGFFQFITAFFGGIIFYSIIKALNYE